MLGVLCLFAASCTITWVIWHIWGYKYYENKPDKPDLEKFGVETKPDGKQYYCGYELDRDGVVKCSPYEMLTDEKKLAAREDLANKRLKYWARKKSVNTRREMGSRARKKTKSIIRVVIILMAAILAIISVFAPWLLIVTTVLIALAFLA